MSELIRILRTAGTVVTHTFTVDEVATNASGPVTFVLYRVDGSIVDSGTATPSGPTGQYEVAVDGRPTVDLLRLEFTGTIAGSVVTVPYWIEVVGAFMISLDRMRNIKPPLSTVTYSLTDLLNARTGAEYECERITGRSFVPRFGRVKLDGSGGSYLVLDQYHIRTLLKITENGTALQQGEIDAIDGGDSGVLYRRGGWQWGRGNVVIEFEYGENFAPADVYDAVLMRARQRLTLSETRVPYRAASMTTQDGVVYRLSNPTGEKTGIPEVDAAYEGAKYGGGFA